MTEIPPPYHDDPLVRSAANVARDLTEKGVAPEAVEFLPLFTSPEEETIFMGRGLYNDAQTMMRRYPVSHASNIAEVINAVRTDKAPATIGDLRAGNIDLTDEEITRLGERRNSTPVLSVARIPKLGLTGLAKHEPSRQELAHWLSAHIDPPLDEIGTIELRLFNDTTELVVGEGRATGADQSDRWVMRFKSYSDEGLAKLQERLAKLEGLVPKTRFVREARGHRTLTLSEWIPGRHATANERDRLEAALRNRGVDLGRLDMHEENVIRHPDGQLVYVDGDYLGT